MWWGALIAQGAQDTKDYLQFQQNKGVSAETKWGTKVGHERRETDRQRFLQDRDHARTQYLHDRSIARQEYLYDTSQKYQREVASAKAAGLHPLFAMGKGGGMHSPSYQTSGTQAPGGQNVGTSRGPGLRFSPQQRLAIRPPQDIARSKLENRLLEQQVEANDIELLAKSSQEMRLQQELLHGPTAARAFSETAAEQDRVTRLNRDFKDRLQVKTPSGVALVGPYGGKWLIPPGVTPQEVWEMLLGETGEIAGVGIGARMAVGKDAMERKRAAHNARVRKQRAKKAQKKVRPGRGKYGLSK